MDPKQKNALAITVIVLLVIGAWVAFWPPQSKITQGLDIQGGLSVILTAQETTSTAVTDSVMDRAELIVRNRVDKLGASEATVQRQGADSILVQLPGIKNAQDAFKILGSTGQLEFVDVASITDTTTVAAIQNGEDKVTLKPGTYAPFMTGEVVTSAAIGTDSTTGKIEVNVTMSAVGTNTWAEYTTSHVNQLVAIVLDGVVQSAPRVNEPITGGQTAISGSFTPEDAKGLKTVLETGALPVTLTFSESRVVGPTLGQDSLKQGVLAALVGLGIVALFMALYYRGLGVLSWFSLAAFSSIFLGVLALLSQFNLYALSLPGVAGIVLTIGLAADSSILIFERFKEEVRMGKTYRSAAKSGTKHAVLTSLDADLVTLVSAVMLATVAIGPVRGFAITLIIGICIDLMVAFLFTRSIVIVLAESVVSKMPVLFGMKGGEADA
ncbi:MAG: protein translocase subunit SecD [Actinomycetota bacterium]|nr:protein translocase subunit SecD [Actinomycetota bacterium]